MAGYKGGKKIGSRYLCHLTSILFQFILKNFLFLDMVSTTIVLPNIFMANKLSDVPKYFFFQINSYFKIISKLVFFYHIIEIIVGDYDFKFNVKTVISDYDLKLKNKTVVTNHDLTLNLKS